MKKILKSEQHPNWKEGVIVYFEDGSNKVYPKIEYVNNSSIKTIINYVDYQGKELKLINNFGF